MNFSKSSENEMLDPLSIDNQLKLNKNGTKLTYPNITWGRVKASSVQSSLVNNIYKFQNT
jgi:hypothetical protein